MVENCKIIVIVECDAASVLLPHIETLRPLCAYAPAGGGPVEFKLAGRNIATERDLLLARQQGERASRRGVGRGSGQALPQAIGGLP